MTRIVVAPPPRPAAAQSAQPVDLPQRARSLGLLGEDDLGWVGALVEVVVQLEAQPWRLALEVIESGQWLQQWRDATAASNGEHATRASDPREVSPRRLSAVVEALRRMLAGRSTNVALARKARALLLGMPALTDEARQARVVGVANELALSPGALDQVLWADLPRERPIEVPAGWARAPADDDAGPPADALEVAVRADDDAGPPEHALDVAALANVSLVQRALRHAHGVEIVIRGDAAVVLRAAAARGLLVTASESVRNSSSGSSVRNSSSDAARETIIDIVGPLALCHGTAVYGRALGALVPVLGGCSDFTLTIHAEARGRTYDLSVAAPVLLPPAPAPAAWPVVHQLARDLERLGVAVHRAPPAIARGGAVVCPDLGVEVGGRTVWIEIVGFWTPAYLARKVQRYRTAGAGEVVLCIDATRACDDDDDAPPDGALVVRFERRIHAEPLAQLLGAGRIKVG